MHDLVIRRLDAQALVQLRSDETLHPLARAHDQPVVIARLGQPPHRQRGFGLAVLG